MPADPHPQKGDSNLGTKSATKSKPTSVDAKNSDLVKDDYVNWIAIIIGVIALVAANLNSLWPVAVGWKNPQYSHGYLIPLFAAVLLWIRREPFQKPSTLHMWCGVAVLGLAVIMRVIGTRYVVFAIDNLSFIPSHP